MAYFLLTLSALFWSGNFILGRGVHTEIPPVALAFWRWSVALGILLPFAIRPLIRQRRLIMVHWPILTILAILSVTNFSTFIYMALHAATAVNTILVNAVTPVLIVCVSWVGFRDRMTWVQAAGVCISLTGLVWIISKGSPAVLLSIELSGGHVWALAAALSWALYTVLLKKRPEVLNPIAFLVTLIIIGLVFMVPIYLWERAGGAVIRPTPAVFGSVVYLAVFPSLLAYIFWNRGVEAVGANKAGIFIHLMPVFGVLLAVLFLEERLERYHLPGIFMIFTGIFLTTTGRRTASD